MAKLRSKTLAQKLQEKQHSRVADHDPEAVHGHSDGDGDGDAPDGSASDSDDNGHDGTEHYVAVGQSKLRKRVALTTLGPRYHGSRVSRAALDNQDQEHDEEGDDEDDDDEEGSFVTAREDESASDSGENSEQAPARPFRNPKIKQRPVAADYITAELGGQDDVVKTGTQNEGSSGADGVGEEEGWTEEGEEEDTVVEDEDHDDGSEEEEELDGEDEDEAMGGLIDDEALTDDDDEEGDDLGDEEDDDDDDDDDVFGLNGGYDDDSEDDDDDEDEQEGGGAPIAQLPIATNQTPKPNAKQAIISSLSETAQKEAQKGLAIRQQRAAFDGLLNIRIRLQKALVAANSFHVLEDEQSTQEDGYKAAEDAAFKLWDALSELRSSRYDDAAQAGEKRKRTSDDPAELWQDMQAYQERRAQHRDGTLDKWSSKLRSNENRANKATLKPLVSALQDQLLDPSDRLVKRSRMPRSCAPTQVSRKTTEDVQIYDDADFYQLLLKELVDQRTVESASESQMINGAIIASVVPPSDVKQRKVVNRKASKGRVMRFTVHEKLLSFMAPEDRRMWEQDAIDRFFGTLLGRKMELDEDQPSDEDEVMAEEEGLRLFRS